MHNNTTSQFMDKQIMDLSNSQTNSNTNNNDFIDFMNRAPSDKKDDVVPSYDFVPIRSTLGSSFQPDSHHDDPPIRSWNSLDSKANATPIRGYNSLDNTGEPTNFAPGKLNNPGNSSLNLVSEIDRTLKKYVDDLMHSMDSMSARLSQLETRTRNLESSIDDLKLSVENNHGTTDGKMRQLENILNEVQNGVQIIRDKQEILEAHREIAKLPVQKVDQQVESHKTAQTDHPTQIVASPHQQFSTTPPPNAPPPPPPLPQQNIQPQVPNPSQFPPNQLPSVPQQTSSYFHAPSQTQENPSQQQFNQMPPFQQQQQQQQPTPPASLPHHQYQPPPPQYSQTPLPQPHPSFPAVNNSSLPQPPLSHQPEETPYLPPPPQPYSPSRLPPSHSSTGIPPPSSQQYYPPPSNAYESPSIRPGPGYPGSYGPSSAHGETYPYNPPPQYGGGSMKTQQIPNPNMGQSGGSGYQQLPTARILPQVLPQASSNVSSGSGSSGTANRVPIEDVVDRVTNMGFPRDQVRATVRKLTESGQSVDLNIVLDKLMNDGEGQGPRGWLGR